MTFLPLVNAYLQTASRRRTTYWLRCLYAAGALAVSLFVYVNDYQAPSSQLAHDWLSALMVVSFLYCMVVGLASTVDCVSQEKRDGTLGLLFLTDLKGWDVVLGKLVGASVGGLYGLLATAPILALSLLLGGVSAGLVGREMVLLLVTFLFQMTVGLLVSALSRKQLRAVVAAGALLLLFNLVFPLVGALILLLVPSHSSVLAGCLFLPCPIMTLIVSTMGIPPVFLKHHFWWSVGVLGGLSCFWLALASWIVPHCWQDRPVEGWKARWRRWRQHWAFGSLEARRGLRRRLLAVNPCCWLAGRARHKPAYVWSFLALVGALWLWGSFHYGADWFHEGVYLPTAVFLNLVLKVWLMLESGRQLFEDRKTGALELIVTTPLSVKEILRGHLLAMGRQFLGPILTVVAVHLIFLAASLQRESFGANPLTPTLWLVGVVLLLADTAAACWVGLWAALMAKRANHPPGMLLVRLLLAPCFLYYILLFVGAVSYGPGPGPSFTWRFFLGLWVAIGLMFDAAYGLVAWWQLRKDFRRMLTEPVGKRRGRWWQRWRRRGWLITDSR